MTIDEAIRHAEEVAEENYGKATAYLSDTRVYEYEEQKCLKCADEHMQLAEWLRDYKRLLEQEPSVSENPNNCDLISRGEVLENAFAIYTHECGLVEVVGVATIKDLPSVNLQEKTGHWEWVQYDSNPNIGNWHCSECRAIIPHMPEEIDNTPIYKWCPMCGAKMIEPQESEEV